MALNDKRYLSANDFQLDCWRLAAKVRESGWRPDVILALWRGGAFPGIYLHEFFKVSGWDVRHLPLKCCSYTGIGENPGGVEFTLADECLALIGRGERVLVVDDVFDTGKTAAAVKSRLDAIGAETRIACVYVKPQKNLTDIVPDYSMVDVGLDWIVFPSEIEGLTEAETKLKNPQLAELLRGWWR